jgi:AraC-like DNA-binding protein
MHFTHQPKGPLASYVEKLWYCDGRGVVHRKMRVLPTRTFQLVISLSDGPLRGPGGPRGELGTNGRSLVVGVRSHFNVIDTATLRSAMGVVFRPGGARSFFDASAEVFLNESIPLELIWGAVANDLCDRLREATTAAEKFHILEAALQLRMDKRIGLHAAVEFALGEFARMPHIRSVVGVARDAGLSRRRFAQLFREQVGITPKLYCRLRRFQDVVKQIPLGMPVNWASVALAGGYCDQAHMANEFRNFSGTSLTDYLASERIIRN